MTDDEMNIAICELRGWKRRAASFPDNVHTWLSPEGYMEPVRNLPNHINGIAALGHMHEAEKDAVRISNEGGTPFSIVRYHDRLIARHGMIGAIIATAKERATALLIEVGKIEETPV